MTDPLLVLQGVTKQYGREVRTPVLHGVDLVVERGEFVALVGPSGSGKSTLLNLIGLLDRPSGGVLQVEGQEVQTLGDAELTRIRGRTLGFVFQFHHLLPSLTALENVALPLVLEAGRTDASVWTRAQLLLEAVGLGHRVRDPVSRLSGGQQQRVAIARALVGRPPLVLADEPTGNLDSVTSRETLALMRQFHQEHGTTFVIVTHDPRLAGQCDRIVTMRDGRIAADERA